MGLMPLSPCTSACLDSAKQHARPGKWLLAGVMLLSLGACATHTGPDLATLAQTQAQLSTQTFSGRFSAYYHDSNGQLQGLTGQFSWLEASDQTAVALRSPLGQTLALIRLTSSGAELTLPDQATQAAPTVDALMVAALGFPLPVEGLRDWLYARPAENRPATLAHDEQGRLQSLIQDGWTIHYRSYATLPSNPDTQPLVKRLDLTRELQDGPIQLRLVLDTP